MKVHQLTNVTKGRVHLACQPLTIHVCVMMALPDNTVMYLSAVSIIGQRQG